jgi:hypothetical protein
MEFTNWISVGTIIGTVTGSLIGWYKLWSNKAVQVKDDEFNTIDSDEEMWGQFIIIDE